MKPINSANPKIKKLLDSKKGSQEQYSKFVKIIDRIIDIPPPEFRHLNFIDFYDEIFRVFSECDPTHSLVLKSDCANYSKQKATHLDYPNLVILSTLLLYLRGNDCELNRWFVQKEHQTKIKSRTLMELCLINIKKDENLKEKFKLAIPRETRKTIKLRIKNYYF